MYQHTATDRTAKISASGIAMGSVVTVWSPDHGYFRRGIFGVSVLQLHIQYVVVRSMQYTIGL